jgi:hypothetical protein
MFFRPRRNWSVIIIIIIIRIQNCNLVHGRPWPINANCFYLTKWKWQMGLLWHLLCNLTVTVWLNSKLAACFNECRLSCVVLNTAPLIEPCVPSTGVLQISLSAADQEYIW